MSILKIILSLCFLSVPLFFFIIMLGIVLPPDITLTGFIGFYLLSVVILVVIASPFAYYQHISFKKRKAINDEYGRAIWLKAEAERQRQKSSSESDTSV